MVGLLTTGFDDLAQLANTFGYFARGAFRPVAIIEWVGQLGHQMNSGVCFQELQARKASPITSIQDIAPFAKDLAHLADMPGKMPSCMKSVRSSWYRRGGSRLYREKSGVA